MRVTEGVAKALCVAERPRGSLKERCVARVLLRGHKSDLRERCPESLSEEP